MWNRVNEFFKSINYVPANFRTAVNVVCRLGVILNNNMANMGTSIPESIIKQEEQIQTQKYPNINNVSAAPYMPISNTPKEKKTLETPKPVNTNNVSATPSMPISSNPKKENIVENCSHKTQLEKNQSGFANTEKFINPLSSASESYFSSSYPLSPLTPGESSVSKNSSLIQYPNLEEQVMRDKITSIIDLNIDTSDILLSRQQHSKFNDQLYNKQHLTQKTNRCDNTQQNTKTTITIFGLTSVFVGIYIYKRFIEKPHNIVHYHTEELLKENKVI